MLDTNDHDIDFDGDFGADFGVDSNASLGLMASPFSPRFGMTSNELDQAISELGACLSPLAARSVPDFPDTGSDGVDFSLEHLDESDLFSDVGICDTDIITADPGPIGEESSAEGRALNGPPQLVPSVTFSLSHQLSGSCQEIVCPHVSPEGVLSVGVLNYGVGKAKAAANDVSVDDHCTTQVRTDRSIVCVIFRIRVAAAEADKYARVFVAFLVTVPQVFMLSHDGSHGVGTPIAVPGLVQSIQDGPSQSSNILFAAAGTSIHMLSHASSTASKFASCNGYVRDFCVGTV